MVEKIKIFKEVTPCKRIIGKIFKYGLVDGDLRITNFDRWIGLSRIVNKRKEKNTDVGNRLHINEKSMKNWQILTI